MSQKKSVVNFKEDALNTTTVKGGGSRSTTDDTGGNATSTPAITTISPRRR